MSTITVDTPIPLLVARGADLLDRERPGWYKDIDLLRFDIGDCGDCVLGQVFHYYDVGIEDLNLAWDNAWKFGFNISGGQPGTWNELDDCWITLILSRRMRDGGL